MKWKWKDLEAYVKCPGDYPCTKLQMDYQKLENSKVEPFLLKVEKKRGYSVSIPTKAEVPEEKILYEKPTVSEPLHVNTVAIPELPPENKEELL